MADAEKRVIGFIVDYWACRPEEIDPSDILRSLGIDGDDAFEFIQEFSARFEVDLEGYIWEFHHSDEGGLLVPSWPFKTPDAKVDRLPLSVEMLVQAVCVGKWTCRYPPNTPDALRLDRFNGIIVALLFGCIGLIMLFLLEQIDVLNF